MKRAQFKNRLGIWKTCLHKSCSYRKMLKLSCFAPNLVRPRSVPVFIWKRVNSENWVENVPGFSHGFQVKRRHLEPYFEILFTLSSRKSCSKQLSCFEFYPVRPLRALNFHFPETGQIRIRIGSFGFSFRFTSYSRNLSRPITSGA